AIQLFQADSYQALLKHYKGQPFVLVIWSVTCPACLSEMALIQQLHQQNPAMNIVMLAVDGPEFHQEMREIIQREKLADLEHWGFAEDNSPALRYAIDSEWYGELPRTYFFDKQHFKRGVSGVLSFARYIELY
ncbi:MAG: redoxin domain-containing protein, partial [Methyloprofundus sp.]|nr:redoxin domain-containing protein [Methyloprofundus sp.]